MARVRSVIAASLFLVLLARPVRAADHPPITQKTYVHRAESQINALSAQLKTLEAKANTLKEDSHEEYQKDVDQIHKKIRLARARLETIRKASHDNWQHLRKEEDELLVHLQKSYTHLKNQYFT